MSVPRGPIGFRLAHELEGLLQGIRAVRERALNVPPRTRCAIWKGQYVVHRTVHGDPTCCNDRCATLLGAGAVLEVARRVRRSRSFESVNAWALAQDCEHRAVEQYAPEGAYDVRVSAVNVSTMLAWPMVDWNRRARESSSSRCFAVTLLTAGGCATAMTLCSAIA